MMEITEHLNVNLLQVFNDFLKARQNQKKLLNI